MSIVYCDTETYSEEPINNGTYKYAENASIMLFTYAFDDGPVQVWDATECHTMPQDLFDALKNRKKKHTFVWHNSMFDRNVIKYHRAIDLPTDNIHDTMVIALLHGLPGGLGKLCAILGVDEDKAKDKRGRQLIQLFCKPQPANRKIHRATSKTHPKDWQAFIEYAIQDIEAMREVYKRLPKWNIQGPEFELWQLDQKINDRGFLVDMEMVDAAIDTIDTSKKQLADKVEQLTDGDVEAATQRDRMLMHICMSYGVALPDLTKSTLERRIQDPELSDGLRQLLAIRLEASTTSVSKYKRLKKGVNKDNRLRGTLQFSGAQRTARWAGRTFQPQNLPRPSHDQDDIETAIELLKYGCMDLFYDDIMKMTSSMLRSTIIASEGHKLVVSDLSNIEGRVAAWLAGEEWKLQAFRNFDAGTGEDLYKLAYARSFNCDPNSVTKKQRQIGKVQELALGYQGGVGAFVTMVATYRMDLDELTEMAYDTIPKNIKAEAHKWWLASVKQKKTFELSEKTFIVCDSLKRLWREAQPAIVSYWGELERAVKLAINKPDTLVTCGKLKIRRDGAWLRIQLPSGRSMCYPAPAVGLEENGSISYMGINPYSRKWQRISTYGGKLFENVCQSVARDVMAYNMPLIDEQFDILLTVHDELITEAPINSDVDEELLSKMLARQPTWAPDLPLAAGGFESYRYRKD